jgi:hypothetical protein
MYNQPSKLLSYNVLPLSSDYDILPLMTFAPSPTVEGNIEKSWGVIATRFSWNKTFIRVLALALFLTVA